MLRSYISIILEHLHKWDQMVLIEGPRQTGKTTLAKQVMQQFPVGLYLNWDNIDDRQQILKGQKFVTRTQLFTEARAEKALIIFDEIHKMPDWKNYLKGFYDSYKDELCIIATGSSKLSTYKTGQDSLMGRYFNYTIYPLTVGELLKSEAKSDITSPQQIESAIFDDLLKYGGFPEPFLKRDDIFFTRWSNLRLEQLFKEDIQVVEDIKNIQLLESLSYILRQNISAAINYSNLAKKIRVSDQTIRKWLTMLENFYYGFTITPWHRNITRSILKEPKFYMLDWSNASDIGARAENFVATHLKKAVSFWNETGQGNFGLHYLRDKEKREIDFAVTKNNEVWFLVEVKNSANHALNPNLYYYQELTKAQHAFQVVLDMPFRNVDCFAYNAPVKVSARSFLSQLP